ncbi:alpha-galactosidase [Pengzhenrongella sicca]|uniref:Alpha-galactosidase n=1 Tax=Pengzhenrongella sicca TaxID=2819238 RepID=A0A8A4ZFH1_9MICO|nr:alpha-galactosidase [Pengzhenrongella sicca]QTE28428.1 alpha-galactosidase [Pengzhenrongella sicca]
MPHPVLPLGADGVVHLRAGGTSLVLDTAGSDLPRVLHWGVDLGVLTDESLTALRRSSEPQVVSSAMDQVVRLGLLPEQSAGWLGTPGIAGHRRGRDFSPAFVVRSATLDPTPSPGAHRLTVTAVDSVAGLGLEVLVDLTAAGLVRTRAAVTNTSETADYTVDSVMLALPIPTRAQEILDFTGRHLRERAPQRHAFTFGTHLRENRRGRTGADATLLLLAGTRGFAFESGEVWGLHVAWSGNHRTLAERLPSGDGFLGGGELLLPGEGTLAPGSTYTTPWIYGSWGRGLDEMAARFHGYLRARAQHPATPRPVVLNTWEAVYFNQDLESLSALADAAAEVGVERFVLDDGWFRHRRDDRSGLGDWYVDEGVWPEGLDPLIEHVRAAGMEFGLWVEPEMINVDSDLARKHPDWILSTGSRLPPEARSQQVLDLGNPAAFAHILERLDALLTENAISYLKWDHNRDLVDAGSTSHGRAGVHDQTLAVYALIDQLKVRHPGLEIESCSSGGARVDLAILERTDRVWASDCIDALERQEIQRWTELLLPPELIGAHVGSPVAHSTGRAHTLSFRAGTALFGHLGVEWDLRTADAAERAELAQWIALYKAKRDLLHTGLVVHVDHQDPALLVHGVVARDGSEALYSIVAVATSALYPPGHVRLVGLDADADYLLAPIAPGTSIPNLGGHAPPPWWTDGVVLPGRVLAQVGVQAPNLLPDSLVILAATRL